MSLNQNPLIKVNDGNLPNGARQIKFWLTAGPLSGTFATLIVRPFTIDPEPLTMVNQQDEKGEHSGSIGKRENPTTGSGTAQNKWSDDNANVIVLHSGDCFAEKIEPNGSWQYFSVTKAGVTNDASPEVQSFEFQEIKNPEKCTVNVDGQMTALPINALTS